MGSSIDEIILQLITTGSQKKIKMDPLKISVICVYMQKNAAEKLCSKINEILETGFYYTMIIETIVVENIHQLKNQLNRMSTYNVADSIFAIGPQSEKQNMITIINQLNTQENKIIQLLAEIPTLLHSHYTEYLYCSWQNKKLIFCFSTDERTIMTMIEEAADTFILAVYLLRHMLTDYDIQVQENEIQTSCKYSEKSSPSHISSLSSISHADLQTDIDISDVNAPKIQQMCLPKVSVNEALTIINKIIKKTRKEMKFESVDIKDACGRILFKAVHSDYNVPPFSIATKHEYAVLKSSKTKKRKVLKTESNEIVPAVLEPDTCVCVNTENSIPYGATAVVPEKNTIKCDDNEENNIDISHSTCEQNIQCADSDMIQHQIIVNAYTRIGPIELGRLAACGCKEVTVVKQLSIGILSIGDKLQEPGQFLKPEYSYDSNRTILISTLKENGFKSLDFGIAINKWSVIIHKIKTALNEADLLVTTGSSNDKDCLKYILKNYFKAILYFGNVNIKPGKSTAFATCTFNNKIKYILCLPQSPASILVTANIFLLPLVNWLHFNINAKRPIVMAKIEQKLPLHLRPRYVWATLSWSEKDNFAKVVCKRDAINNTLFSSEDANALLRLPSETPNTKTLEAPSFVPAILIKFPNSS